MYTTEHKGRFETCNDLSEQDNFNIYSAHTCNREKCYGKYCKLNQI
jgi:hypothetical protein